MNFHQSPLNTPSLFIPISLGLQAVFLNTLSLRPAENKLACTHHTSTKVTGTIHVYWFSPLTAIHFPALFLQMINRWHRSNMMPGLCRVQYRFFSLLIYTSKDVNVLQCLLWVYKIGRLVKINHQWGTASNTLFIVCTSSCYENEIGSRLKFLKQTD